MSTPTYRPQLPAAAPSPAELAERDRFQALVGQSLPSVRASAEVWRNGLAAFITLVTTGVVLKGRDVAADLSTGWRVAITALVLVGIGAAVVGLWAALIAQAGGRSRIVTLQNLLHTFGSVAAYEVVAARNSAQWLVFARYSVGVALIALMTGIGLSWWAPKAPATPPAYVRVLYGEHMACGELKGADGGRMTVAMKGRNAPVVVPLSQISQAEIVARCTR